MTLPFSRNTTYVAGPPGSQVKSADLNAIQDQIIALHAAATAPRTKFPTPIVVTNWATAATFAGSSTPGLVSSGAGSAFVDLDVPQGYKLASLTLCCGGNASANLTIEVDKAPTGNSGNVSLGALVLNALSGTVADQILDMLATSTGLTVTVAVPGSATYTRSVGSFITDGFFVGQIVTWAGFSNAGNNQTVTITALTATVMTCAAGTATAETGGAAAESVVGVSPVVDSTFALQLKLTASASGISVKSLRYTCVLA